LFKAPGRLAAVLSWILVVIVTVVVAAGQALLVRAAWRFRTTSTEPPPGVPRSDPRGDLAWTLVTALGTLIVLAFVIQSLL
jgi:heme/copper-type cytochrome/quinol oxidase subunit 2